MCETIAFLCCRYLPCGCEVSKVVSEPIANLVIVRGSYRHRVQFSLCCVAATLIICAIKISIQVEIAKAGKLVCQLSMLGFS